ncbi:M23 family metallopeptidase [Antribacter gilvus]|uniref:M23 family metallopeptidase n=1 Tax=Antribacter gilvus TaxID=2304675 RepID=UPI000F7A07ED|nr:M23 family metallopeptidase [Antribacter gilvus]
MRPARPPEKPSRRGLTILLALIGAVLIGIPAMIVGVVVLVGGAVVSSQSSGGAMCQGGTSVVPAGNLPESAAGFSGEQLQNAAVILRVGQERGVPARAQAIAVMTAIGESGLRNLTYGDDVHGVRNPDGSLTSSIGMFQEQKWFGSVESRLDPVQSSGRFYDRLLAVAGWQALEPTVAAHKAQRNADPYHYAKYWDQAVTLVSTLSGAPAEELQALAASAAAPCLTGSVGNAAISAGGWANPAVGRKASGYGPRHTGIAGASTYHLGQDIAASCGTPVYAAAAGRVVLSGGTGWGTGNTIRIEHGLGLDTTYGHLLTGTLTVRTGEIVRAGQQIASMGGDRRIDPAGAGTSSGCHLHYEVRMNGAAMDPEPFMLQQGVSLGSAVAATEPVDGTPEPAEAAGP